MSLQHHHGHINGSLGCTEGKDCGGFGDDLGKEGLENGSKDVLLFLFSPLFISPLRPLGIVLSALDKLLSGLLG